MIACYWNNGKFLIKHGGQNYIATIKKDFIDIISNPWKGGN